jgi:hypothetical protein
MLERNYMVYLPNGKYLSMDVVPDITIKALKHTLENILFIPANQQRLVVEDQELHDEQAILEDVMEHRFVIHLLLDVHGGCRYKKATSMFRWKWKKKRTKRLQRKRRKMRMRAR